MCEEVEVEPEESDRELRSFSSLFSPEFTEFWVRTELLRARCPPSTGLPPPQARPQRLTAASSQPERSRAGAEVHRASKIKAAEAFV